MFLNIIPGDNYPCIIKTQTSLTTLLKLISNASSVRCKSIHLIYLIQIYLNLGNDEVAGVPGLYTFSGADIK